MRKLFLGLLAISVVLLSGTLCCGQTTSDHEFYRNKLQGSQGYENCKTVTDAVLVLGKELEADGKIEYSTLINEQGVRQAIRTGVKHCDALMSADAIATNHPSSLERWKNQWKPTFLKIADTDEWPADCTFMGFYGWGDANGIQHDGFGLRLSLKTADGHNFALPIIDLSYGGFPR
jgi:hypothetical protein